MSKPPTGLVGAPRAGQIDDRVISNMMQQMSPSQLQNLVASAQSLASSAMDQFTQRLDGSELLWIQPPPANPLFQLNGVSITDPLPLIVAEKTRVAGLGFRMRDAAIQRTRLRLLDIHTQILAFQWRYGRLPKKLAEVASGIDLDPLNGGTFVYKILSGGGYELLSSGTAEIGPITLLPTAPAVSKAATP